LRAELAGLVVIDEVRLRGAAAWLEAAWDALNEAERRRVVQLVVDRVTYAGATNEIEVRFRAAGLVSL
jgi:hypothetical protein